MARLDASWRTIQITMYAKIGKQSVPEVAANFALEGEGRGKEGWTVHLGALNQTDTDIDLTLFDALLKDL